MAWVARGQDRRLRAVERVRVLALPRGMSRPQAVLCRGGWPGGFRGWEPASVIIYGLPAAGLQGVLRAGSRMVAFLVWR